MVHGKKLLFVMLNLMVLVGLIASACSNAAPASSPAATKPAQTAATSTAPATKPATSPTAAAAKPIKLTFTSHSGPGTHPEYDFFKTEVEKRSGGRVTVDIYYGGALAKGTEALQTVGKGIADIGQIGTPMFERLTPLTTVSNLIFVSEKVDAVAWAMTDLFDTYAPLNQEWKANNIKPLFNTPMIPPAIITKKPVRTLADFKGMKFRALGAMAIGISKVGGVPVGLEWNECYMGLQTGTIDGVAGSHAVGIWEQKFYEQGKYVLDTGMGAWYTTVMGMNLDTWNKLPPDIQKIVTDVSKEATDVYFKVCQDQQTQVLADFKKAGVELISLSPQDKKDWANMSVQIKDQWIKDQAGRTLPGQEMLDKYMTALKKYEPQSKYVSIFEMAKK